MMKAAKLLFPAIERGGGDRKAIQQAHVDEGANLRKWK